MSLSRLAVRVDGRLLVAALGLAAAFLVPLAGVLASKGLAATVGVEAGGLHVAQPGEGLGGVDLVDLGQATWVLAGRDVGGRHLVAFVQGPTVVAAGQAYDGGPPGRVLRILDQNLTTIQPNAAPVGPGLTLVHPSVLGSATPEAAFFRSNPGNLLPARGPDAFEVAGIADLQDQTWALVFISLPVVILVAAAFARLEAKALSDVVALVAALGKPERAGQLLVVRVLLLVGLGAVACLAALYALTLLRLLPVQWDAVLSRPVLLALLVLAGSAALAGATVGWRITLRPRSALRAKPALGDEPRLGFLPLPLRPWIAGWRLLGVFVLVGAVVALDVGLPLAASGIPASLAGEDGEWVLGGTTTSITSGRALEAAANVMALDPEVDAIVAETFVPTTLQGKPFLLRGGQWASMSTYHGVGLTEGRAPLTGEVALGVRAAQAFGLGLGDSLMVAGETGLLGRFQVVGLVDGSGLIPDEGVLEPGDARRMANLPAGTVHALRLRPETPEAVAAVQRGTPRIELLRLRIEPPDPQAGSVASAVVEGANLGAAAGTRVLQLRVDGLSAGTATLHLGPYQRGNASIPFVVPAGPFEAQVNPEASATGSTSPYNLTGPFAVAEGGSARFVLQGPAGPVADVAVRLYPDLAAAAAGTSLLGTLVTDADGSVTIPGNQTGAVVLVADATADSASTQLYVVAEADAGRVRGLVETVYLLPGAPSAGQQATIAARVRNVGGIEGPVRLDFQVDGNRIAIQDVVLEAGEQRTVTQSFIVQRTGAPVTVNGVRASSPVAVATADPPVDPGKAQHGGALQAAVADRLLGNARTVLGGLAVTAGTASVAVLVLAVQRTMAQRAGILAVLATAWTPAEIRRRAAIEAGILGFAGGFLGIGIAKLAIFGLGAVADVRVFGHALPDPFGWLFVIQVCAATSFLASLAMWNGVGRRLGKGTARVLRSGAADL